MENELIKTKIENLIKETKQLKIDDVISYIKIKFPENEFSWENIDERSDFYYDRRDIIHLTNQTDLIINYPGGDRFGDIFAEPYTDISFHNLKLINKYDDLEDKLYLFLNDKYNSLNEINKNNDTVAGLEEQLNTLSKKYNIGIQLKEDICKMVKNNQIKDINMLYQSLISDYNTNDLNNYSEEEFIVMIKDITSSKLLQLEPMNNELINLNETLSKISISKPDNEIENNDNVYKEYDIIYKNEDNYEMEM